MNISEMGCWGWKVVFRCVPMAAAAPELQVMADCGIVVRPSDFSIGQQLGYNSELFLLLNVDS